MTRLIRKVRRSGHSQASIAQHLAISEPLLSRMLHGLRTTPADFEERLDAVLALLDEAEAAADQAREKVLAKHR